MYILIKTVCIFYFKNWVERVVNLSHSHTHWHTYTHRSWDSSHRNYSKRFLEAGPLPGTRSYTLRFLLPVAEECASCGTGNEKWKGPAPSCTRLWAVCKMCSVMARKSASLTSLREEKGARVKEMFGMSGRFWSQSFLMSSGGCAATMKRDN